MSGKRSFPVAVSGISEAERQVLRNIFKLSSYRTRSYVLVEALADAEILMIDLDDQRALADYQALSKRGLNKRLAPLVMVTRASQPDVHRYAIRRPFVATRVLRVLDQVVIKELSFVPELVIGDDTNLSNPAAEVLQQAPKSDELKQKSFKALVVDDSLAVRKLIELELRALNIQGDFAENAATAFRFLESSTYDIIFLDVVLPDVDGYKICKTIKKDRATKKTPVLMLTGKSSPFDRVKGKFAGCDSYITKPAKSETFRKAIKQYLPIETDESTHESSDILSNQDELIKIAEPP